MRTNLWKRAAAFLVAGTLAVSMFAMNAGAVSEPEEVAIVKQAVSCTSDYSPEESRESYQKLSELLQKYPNASELWYLRAMVARPYTNSRRDAICDIYAVLADLDKAIALEKENAPHEEAFYTLITERMEQDIGTRSSRMEAAIYLDTVPDQQKYLEAMQNAIDLERKNILNDISPSEVVDVSQTLKDMIGPDSEGDIILGFYMSSGNEYRVRDLYRLDVQQKQLDEIKQWAKENGTSFHAWDDRVQVTGGAGSTTITIDLPQQAGTYTYMDPYAELVPDPNGEFQSLDGIRYTIKKEQYDYVSVKITMTYYEPIQQVVRGLNSLYVVGGGYGSEKITYQMADGSTVDDRSSLNKFDIGDYQDFSYDQVSVPENLATKYPRQSFDYLGDVEWFVE